MLKLFIRCVGHYELQPAAFGRLCVETPCRIGALIPFFQPPSGGCVLKRLMFGRSSSAMGPAAFGRLCVETLFIDNSVAACDPAAFGRLCVETIPEEIRSKLAAASRLRAAVC